MLVNDFYLILSHEPEETGPSPAGKFVYNIRLADSHRVYEGHFPGNPVVPGVCQVAIITELISDLLKKEMVLESADQIKYLGIIRPVVNRDLKVELDVRSSEMNRIHVNATIGESDKIFTKFRGIFREETQA